MKIIISTGLLLISLVFAVNCQRDKSSPPPTETSTFEKPTDTIPEGMDTLDIRAGQSSSTVYVCESTGAKRYHYSLNCRGLRRCSHNIVKMARKKAECRGLTLCGYESKD